MIDRKALTAPYGRALGVDSLAWWREDGVFLVPEPFFSLATRNNPAGDPNKFMILGTRKILKRYVTISRVP
jgi:hypothetical protein